MARGTSASDERGTARTEESTATSVCDDTSNGSTASPDATTHKSSHLPQYCAGAVACMVSTINGISYGWPSVALPILQSPTASPLTSGPLSDEEASWVASLLYLSGMMIIPPSAWMFPRCGRKIFGYVSAGFLFLEWLVLAATHNTAGLYVARVLGGAAGGLLFFFTPAYTREVSEDAIRGSVGSLMSLSFNMGILIVYSAGAVLTYEALNLLGLGMTCAYCVAFWWLPETPPSLVARGKTAEAERALRWLRGPRADVAGELRALESAVKRRRAEDAASLAQLFGDKASVKGLLLACLMCANQPLCGFFVVLNYAVSIFTEASPNISPHLAASIVGALCVVGSVLTTRLVERLGRKVLFLTSDGAMAVCLAALGAYSYLKSTGVDVSAFNWLPVASLSIFMAAVTLAVTTLPFVIITEIFLPQAQQLATLLGAISIVLLGFLATKFFSSIIQFFGLHTCYWFFSAMCVLISLCLYIALPETKGRSLESIRKELAGEKEEKSIPNAKKSGELKESV